MSKSFRWLFLACVLALAVGVCLDFHRRYGYDAQPTAADTLHQHVWCFEDKVLEWVNKPNTDSLSSVGNETDFTTKVRDK